MNPSLLRKVSILSFFPTNIYFHIQTNNKTTNWITVNCDGKVMGGWETTKCDVFEMKGGKGGGGKDLWITVSCDGMELTDNSTGPTNSTGKRVPCKGDISFKTVHGSRCKVDLGTFLNK